MRRTHLFHTGLFLLAYAACLFYYWCVEPHGFVTDKAGGALHRDVVVVRKIAAAVLPRSPPKLSEQLAGTSIRAAQPHQEPAVSATPATAASEWSEATQRQVAALSTQAINADAPAERARAIIKLRYTEKTPQAVQTLADVLNSEKSGQNRVLAIASLLNMARQGDEGGLIKTALIRATSDQDPRVSARARNALESLSEATGVAE